MMNTPYNSTINTALVHLTRLYGQVFLLAVAILLTYSHTLDVPFYLDDFSSIQENPVIYNWKHTFKELWQFSALRIVGYFSFALNYQFHQFQVAGYHVVNILIHFLTGCAVLGLLRGLVQTPKLSPILSETAKCWLPFVVALLFILHPLQIQAVTYIVQRLASLAALFYIGAMACFVQARLSASRLSISSFPWTIACLLCISLAFFTKQNTATLPIALLLIEFTFFASDRKHVLSIIGGIILLGLVFAKFILAPVFGYNLFSFQSITAILHSMEELTRETTTISRSSYLMTQFSVIWVYIRLFFIPVGLHIDYAYPITESFWQIKVLVALLGHLALLGSAIYSFKRLPLLAFGILFYYLAHAIESSLIPIIDVIFEHRTYLPNLGLCILCGWLFVVFLPTWLEWRKIQIILSVLFISLAANTWQRNQIWRDPIALWDNNTQQSPEKKRAWVILGKHLIQANRPADGIIALEQSVDIKMNPDGSVQAKTFTVEAMLNMVVAYKMLGKYEQALSFINQSVSNPNLRPFDRAKFLVNQGNIFYEQKRFAETETAYRQAIAIYPQTLIARINLASVLAITGRFAEAETLYLEVLKIDPSNQGVRENLRKVRDLNATPRT